MVTCIQMRKVVWVLTGVCRKMVSTELKSKISLVISHKNFPHDSDLEISRKKNRRGRKDKYFFSIHVDIKLLTCTNCCNLRTPRSTKCLFPFLPKKKKNKIGSGGARISPFQIQKTNFCFNCSFSVAKSIRYCMALYKFSTGDDNVSACLGHLREVLNIQTCTCFCSCSVTDVLGLQQL